MSQRTSPHIVMLHKAYPPWVGGIERHVRDISEALAARGWRVTALVCNDAGFETREWRAGVRVIRVKRWGSWMSQPLTWGYSSRLRALKPDVVHVHTPFPLGWLAARRVDAQTPVVCTWHSDIVRQAWAMPLLHSYEQAFLGRCQRILTTSPILMQHSKPLQSHLERCVPMPLCLPADKNEIDDNAAASIRAAYKNPIVLFVGRLVGYKGLPYLLRAMKRVDGTLLIAGEGALRDSLEKQARDQIASGQVHFLGHVDEAEKKALYRAADVFVLPSIERNEAFGYVLLEAMREGAPVISTDLPTGVRFVNQHEETGLVVPRRDEEALADAIRKITGDPALRAAYSSAAKERASREFDFTRSIDALEAEYHQVLSSGKR